MRIDDSTLNLAIQKFEGLDFTSRVGNPYTPGTVYAGEVLSALQELQTRRTQDAWVRQQMLGDTPTKEVQ